MRGEEAWPERRLGKALERSCFLSVPLTGPTKDMLKLAVEEALPSRILVTMETLHSSIVQDSNHEPQEASEHLKCVTAGLKRYYLIYPILNNYKWLMATILDKTATEDERPMEQNKIIPTGPAKATLDQATAASRHGSNKAHCYIPLRFPGCFFQSKSYLIQSIAPPHILSRQKPPIPTDTLSSSQITLPTLPAHAELGPILMHLTLPSFPLEQPLHPPSTP